MNDQVLSYMIAIAEEGSLSKAASRLFISQPTLSRILQKTEDELGETLFYRTSKGLVPTPSGMYFLDRARRILKLYNDMHSDFCSINTLHKGVFTIAAPTRLCSIVLPDSLKIFKSKYPNVDIRIKEIAGGRTEEEVLSAKADIGFIYLPPQMEGLVSVPLFDIISDVLIPKGHPANKKAYFSEKTRTWCMDIRDLKDYEFILPDDSTNSRRFAERVFKAADIVPKVSLEAVNLDIITGLVAAGLGISLIPRLTGLMYEKFYDKVNIYNLDEKYDCTNTIAVIYNNDSSLTASTKEYMSILKSMNWDEICSKYRSTRHVNEPL